MIQTIGNVFVPYHLQDLIRFNNFRGTYIMPQNINPVHGAKAGQIDHIAPI